MRAGVQDPARSYYTPQQCPLTMLLAVGWAESLLREVMGLGGSGVLGCGLFGCLGFFGCLLFSLGDWRKAVSRIASPRGLVLCRHRNPLEGVVPRPSGDAWGCNPMVLY